MTGFIAKSMRAFSSSMCTTPFAGVVAPSLDFVVSQTQLLSSVIKSPIKAYFPFFPFRKNPIVPRMVPKSKIMVLIIPSASVTSPIAPMLVLKIIFGTSIKKYKIGSLICFKNSITGVPPLELINSILSIAEKLNVSPDFVLVVAIWCFVGECFLVFFLIRTVLCRLKKNKPD